MNLLMNYHQILTRASQIAKMFWNPQILIKNCLPDVPQEMQSDPNKIIDWLQQTGKVSPDDVQLVNRIAGMK